jgi:hypothetical protein
MADISSGGSVLFATVPANSQLYAGSHFHAPVKDFCFSNSSLWNGGASSGAKPRRCIHGMHIHANCCYSRSGLAFLGEESKKTRIWSRRLDYFVRASKSSKFFTRVFANYWICLDYTMGNEWSDYERRFFETLRLPYRLRPIHWGGNNHVARKTSSEGNWFSEDLAFPS